MPIMRIRYLGYFGVAAQKQISNARRNVSERKAAAKKLTRLRN